MKYIKNLFQDKRVKILLGLVLAYLIFLAVKRRLKIIKVNNAFSTGHSLGTGSDGLPVANIQVLAENLFGLFYNDITEDEAACIATIKKVPVSQIAAFSQRYNKLCIDRKGNFHWWTGYNHIPENLISDCRYFLEGNYKQIENLLNQI